MVKAPQSEERLARGGPGNNSVLGKSCYPRITCLFSREAEGNFSSLKVLGAGREGMLDFNFPGVLALLGDISADYFYVLIFQ